MTQDEKVRFHAKMLCEDAQHFIILAMKVGQDGELTGQVVTHIQPSPEATATRALICLLLETASKTTKEMLGLGTKRLGGHEIR